MLSLAARVRGIQFRAVLYHAQNRVARDHANDVTAIRSAAYHRHLVDVRGQQAFEQAQERLFRRGPQNMFTRDHGGLDGIVGPLFARDGVEHVNVHHANEAVVCQDEMAAPASAKNFGTVFLERNMAADRGNFLAHNVGGAQPSKRFPYSNLGDAFLSGVEQEPADENEPQTGLPIGLEKEGSAVSHDAIGHKFSGGASDARSSRKVFGFAPHDSAENSAAIQGKAWDQVEGGQAKVYVGQPARERTQNFAARKHFLENKKYAKQKETRHGAGNGNVEFLNSFGRIPANAGDTAENEERDGDDANFVVLRDDAVRKLVKQNGAKKEQAGEQAHSPLFRLVPVRVILRELCGKGKRDQRKDNQPAGMQVDGNAENFADTQA